MGIILIKKLVLKRLFQYNGITSMRNGQNNGPVNLLVAWVVLRGLSTNWVKSAAQLEGRIGTPMPEVVKGHFDIESKAEIAPCETISTPGPKALPESRFFEHANFHRSSDASFYVTLQAAVSWPDVPSNHTSASNS